MSFHYLKFFLVFLITLSLIAGCGQSDDQRKFEQQALQPANGFTRTAPDGTVIENDPDDWRVAPFFQGLVEISPAYPNPVLTNNQVTIEFFVTGIESVMGLEVFVRYDDGSFRLIYDNDTAPFQTGLTLVQINPLELGKNSPGELGLYRVIFFDRNENIITYGDIMVE
jgi:hypothetical protein